MKMALNLNNSASRLFYCIIVFDFVKMNVQHSSEKSAISFRTLTYELHPRDILCCSLCSEILSTYDWYESYKEVTPECI